MELGALGPVGGEVLAILAPATVGCLGEALVLVALVDVLGASVVVLEDALGALGALVVVLGEVLEVFLEEVLEVFLEEALVVFLEEALVVALEEALEVVLEEVLGGLAVALTVVPVVFWVLMRRQPCRTSIPGWLPTWIKCRHWRMPTRNWRIRSGNGMTSRDPGPSTGTTRPTMTLSKTSRTRYVEKL